jgi:hypothetical protein
MSDTYPTIARLFTFGDHGWLDNIENEKEIVSLHHNADKEPGIVSWSTILDEVKDQIETLLDIGIPEVVAGAWNTAGKLVEYLDKEKYPPDETVIVSLVKHSIVSNHHPYVEVMIDDVTMGKVHLDIDVEMVLEGFYLKIQAGKIKEIETGICKAKGSIGIEGVTLMEEKMKPITLPGVISLGEGIEITC